MIPGSASQFFLGASKAAASSSGYQIERSLRFNSSDSAYLSRTPASAGNRKTWTWAGWVKRSAITSTRYTLFASGSSGSAETEFYFEQSVNADTLNFYHYPGSYQGHCRTIALFRDTSAWYHIVLAVDTTQATPANRCKIYVNSVQQAATFLTNFTQNADLYINSTLSHGIAYSPTEGYAFSGYLADIHFIGGSALDPTSFGEFDTNGIWQPKTYTGSYSGTNSFHLPFSDNSTAAALGTDTSGAGNTWTVNNISVTAGAGNDSLVDSPTNYGTDTGAGGEVRGNYCTLNPLAYGGDIQAPTNGNLDVTSGTSSDGSILGTFGMSSGKWYFEVTCNNANTSGIGIAKFGVNLADYPGQQSQAWVVQTQTPFYKVNNNSPTALTGTFNSGDVIGVAFDADNGNLSFYQNGSVIASNAYTGLTDGPYLPIVGDSNSTPSISLSCNFGQRLFAYTAPSGFKALCTQNLGSPLIAQGSTVMDVALYTGNGSTQTISGLGFNSDLVFIKSRNQAAAPTWIDSVRGGTLGLFSSATNGDASIAGITTFNSNGFILGVDNDGYTNYTGRTYVAWCWDAGSSTVTNTAGSITSTVRANATAGFSIVTFNIGASGTKTVGHGLGVAPEFIITKSRGPNAFYWYTYSKILGTSQKLELNTTNAAAFSSNVWSSTAPSSTVFGIVSGQTQPANDDIVAYCFAPVAGYSNGFSYTGNGSTDGVFVYLGLRAKLLLIKRTDSTGNWYLWDTVRNTYNVVGEELYPNLSNAASTATDLDILSNGFKMRATTADFNASGGTYIGFAWAEAPFAYSRAR